jgi:hypothetical protein
VITVHDFLMLGKTKPEERSDGRTFVCSAGYSPTLRSLIRVYPLAMREAPKRWDIHSVNLERNPKDPRPASYRIAAQRDPDHHTWINREFHRTGTVRRAERAKQFHHSVFIDSIQQANHERKSLGLINPLEVEVQWRRPDTRNPLDVHQLELFSVAAKDKPERIPYLAFTDSDGDHALQLRDWGVYELMRTHGPDYASRNTAQALHLNPDSVLLVGNVLSHQRVWLVISVLNLHINAQLTFEDAEVAA